jgi:SAM-dependent methyltransferase
MPEHDSYDETTYGERVADVYDDWYTSADEAAIDLLAELAGSGPALELGIGSGRVALPLQQRGVEVHGIDASGSMVARLRAKPGGADIPVTMGDFAGVPVNGSYPLIYVVFNTIFTLLTQDEQLRCFENVAHRLTPSGVFVVEAFVPDLARFSGGQSLRTVDLTSDMVRLDASQHDLATQTVSSQSIALSVAGVRLYPVRLRYIWPAEMDLMARLAGLELKSRWGGWERAPFTSASGRHISVYGQAG